MSETGIHIPHSSLMISFKSMALKVLLDWARNEWPTSTGGPYQSCEGFGLVRNGWMNHIIDPLWFGKIFVPSWVSYCVHGATHIFKLYEFLTKCMIASINLKSKKMSVKNSFEQKSSLHIILKRKKNRKEYYVDLPKKTGRKIIMLTYHAKDHTSIAWFGSDATRAAFTEIPYSCNIPHSFVTLQKLDWHF